MKQVTRSLPDFYDPAAVQPPALIIRTAVTTKCMTSLYTMSDFFIPSALQKSRILTKT